MNEVNMIWFFKLIIINSNKDYYILKLKNKSNESN